MNQPKPLLSIEETAQILGISKRTLYNRTAPKSENPFPVKAKRIGRLVKFLTRDIEAYIESL